MTYLLTAMEDVNVAFFSITPIYQHAQFITKLHLQTILS